MVRIVDSPGRFELWFRAKPNSLLSLILRKTDGTPVWQFIHSSFQPVKGESITLSGPFKITRQPASKIQPDSESVASEMYRSRIIFGEVPAGYRQEFPPNNAPPVLEPQAQYYVLIWSTEDTERVIFKKA